MRTGSIVTLAAATLASTVIAQVPGSHGGNNGNGQSSQGAQGFGAAPSCMSSCWSNSVWQNGGMPSLCGNTTAIDAFNSCVSGSSCSNDDKTGAYQVLAQLCANTGTTVSATPEATFSATSGGSSWPTSNSAWASYASSFATITGAPTANPFNATNHPGWTSGAGYGPFGHGGPGNGWGPWASDTTGSWTAGPWTSWWGTNGCPPSTWSGWTSGTWATNAPWTSWTGCTASTTGSSVVTTTVTTGSSTGVVTSTSFGVQLAQATTSGTATGSAASATNSASGGERRAVAGVGAGLVGLLGAVLAL